MTGRLPNYGAHLNPGTEDGRIREIEVMGQVSLPQAYYAIYRDCNGEKPNSGGLFFGLSLLSIDDALSEMEGLYDIIDGGLDGLDDDCTSNIEGVVKHDYLHKQWIPLLSDGCGNYVGLDFAPGPNGTVGQVINFGRDEDIKHAFAQSLDEFIDKFYHILEAPEVICEDGQYLYSDMHFIDALKTL